MCSFQSYMQSYCCWFQSYKQSNCCWFLPLYSLVIFLFQSYTESSCCWLQSYIQSCHKSAPIIYRVMPYVGSNYIQSHVIYRLQSYIQSCHMSAPVLFTVMTYVDSRPLYNPRVCWLQAYVQSSCMLAPGQNKNWSYMWTQKSVTERPMGSGIEAQFQPEFTWMKVKPRIYVLQTLSTIIPSFVFRCFFFSSTPNSDEGATPFRKLTGQSPCLKAFFKVTLWRRRRGGGGTL